LHKKTKVFMCVWGGGGGCVRVYLCLCVFVCVYFLVFVCAYCCVCVCVCVSVWASRHGVPGGAAHTAPARRAAVPERGEERPVREALRHELGRGQAADRRRWEEQRLSHGGTDDRETLMCLAQAVSAQRALSDSH